MARADEKEVLILNIYRNEKTGELRGDYIGWDKLFPANGRWDGFNLTEEELKALIESVLDRGKYANRKEHITVSEILPCLLEHYASVNLFDICACAEKVGKLIKAKEPRVTIVNEVTEDSIKDFVKQHEKLISINDNEVSPKKPFARLEAKWHDEFYRYGFVRRPARDKLLDIVWSCKTIEDFHKAVSAE